MSAFVSLPVLALRDSPQCGVGNTLLKWTVGLFFRARSGQVDPYTLNEIDCDRDAGLWRALGPVKQELGESEEEALARHTKKFEEVSKRACEEAHGHLRDIGGHPDQACQSFDVLCFLFQTPGGKVFAYFAGAVLALGVGFLAVRFIEVVRR